MMMQKSNIKKEDTVVVNAGSYKGVKGKVLAVDLEKNRAFVQGVAMVKKHMKARSAQEKGGIIEKEGPVALSNIQLYCKKCDKPVRVSHKILQDGKKVRACRKCGEII